MPRHRAKNASKKCENDAPILAFFGSVLRDAFHGIGEVRGVGDIIWWREEKTWVYNALLACLVFL